ncbi:MAG: hypothetical protein AAFP69_13815 [Planctomycetota bacterium]
MPGLVLLVAISLSAAGCTGIHPEHRSVRQPGCNQCLSIPSTRFYPDNQRQDAGVLNNQCEHDLFAPGVSDGNEQFPWPRFHPLPTRPVYGVTDL